MTFTRGIASAYSRDYAQKRMRAMREHDQGAVQAMSFEELWDWAGQQEKAH